MLKRKSEHKHILYFSILILIALFAVSFFSNQKKESQAASWADNYASAFYNQTSENDSTFYISNGAELARLAYLVNNNIGNYKYLTYILIDSVDLQSYDWVPIGIGDNMFQGTFLGQKNIIHSMNISQNYGSGVGLFGKTLNAKIEEISVSGKISFTNAGPSFIRVGGIVGDGKNTNLKYILSNVQVNVPNHNQVGGIGGYFDGGELTNLANHSNVNGSGQVGGLFGYLKNANISQSFNLGNITAKYNVAGLVSNYSFDDN